jgi:orotate phosphoribosyltransferase
MIMELSHNMSDRESLLHLLQTRALEVRKVILSSGRTSDYYIDCKRVTLSPEGAYLTAKLMLNLIRPDAAAVGGLTLGADPIVSAIAVLSYVEGRTIPALIVRKEPKRHGTRKFIEGPTISQRAKVVVVDDVVTTGASLLKAAEKFSMEGYEVIQAIAILDRLEGGREAIADAGLRLQSLFTRDDLLIKRT